MKNKNKCVPWSPSYCRARFLSFNQLIFFTCKIVLYVDVGFNFWRSGVNVFNLEFLTLQLQHWFTNAFAYIIFLYWFIKSNGTIAIKFLKLRPTKLWQSKCNGTQLQLHLYYYMAQYHYICHTYCRKRPTVSTFVIHHDILTNLL